MKKQSIYLVIALTITLFSCSNDNGDILQEPTKSSAKQITSFIFYNDESETLYEDVVATIDEINKIITAIVPSNTNRALLVPNIKISPNASIAPEGMQDFTNAKPYTVTAENGSEITYTVTVTTELNSEKQILSFVYAMAENLELVEDVEVAIDEDQKQIFAVIPSYIKSFSLLPTIEISEGATLTKSQDVYTVTAEDGSSQDYGFFKVFGAHPRYVLIELFRDNPGNTLNWNISEKDLSTWEGVTTNLEGNITELRLPSKNIATIPINFEFLNALKLLYLSFNQITTLPDELGRLNELNFLEMSGNNFAEIPSVVWELEGLKSLSITKMHLTTIPQEITQLSNLTSLNLNNNDITSLPSYLKELFTIDLRNNKITSIPSEIGDFAKLNGLYLSDNNIRIIPSNIGDLNELVQLALDNNDIRFISKNIGLLPKLEKLLLKNNDLLSLPKEIGNLHTLKLMDVTLNPDLLNIPIEICNLDNSGTEVKLDSQTTCQ